MAYTFCSRVRYSEVGEDERLTLNGIINYFQDCSTFHSEDVGLGLHTLLEMGRGWVLSSWQIVVNRYPVLGEEVYVKTWPYAFKGFMGNRNFTLETIKGERLAYANTLWIFMDVVKGRPTPITKNCIKGYVLEEPLDMHYTSRKIHVHEESVEAEAFRVRSYHLDTNHHVNNGQYVRMAREFVPEELAIGQMRAEYRRQALLGDMIVPKVHQEGAVYTVSLCDEEGSPYAVIEFTKAVNR